MEPNFKFEIGDQVVPKTAMESYVTEAKMNWEELATSNSRWISGRWGSPKLLAVITRMCDQCPAGVLQHHYTVRWYDGKAIQMNEVELQKWDRDAWLAEYEELKTWAKQKAAAVAAEAKGAGAENP